MEFQRKQCLVKSFAQRERTVERLRNHYLVITRPERDARRLQHVFVCRKQARFMGDYAPDCRRSKQLRSHGDRGAAQERVC